MNHGSIHFLSSENVPKTNMADFFFL